MWIYSRALAGAVITHSHLEPGSCPVENKYGCDPVATKQTQVTCVFNLATIVAFLATIDHPNHHSSSTSGMNSQCLYWSMSMFRSGSVRFWVKSSRM